MSHPKMHQHIGTQTVLLTLSVRLCIALALSACSTPQTPSTPSSSPSSSSSPFLPPPPAITPQPAHPGRLWLDFSLGDLWSINLATGAVISLSVPATVFPSQPALTPDGAHLAYLGAEKTSADTSSDRYAIYLDGAPLLPINGDLSYADPALSADGRQVWVTRIGVPTGASAQHTSGLAVQQVDVASPLTARLTITEAYQPTLSPSGDWLVYVRITQPLSGTKEIRVRQLSTGEDRRVVSDTQFYDVYAPRWLNNEQVIFAATDGTLAQDVSPTLPTLLGLIFPLHIATAHTWSGQVWRVQVSDGALKQLTQQPLQAPIVAPAPDGTQIAVLSGEGIWLMQSDGSQIHLISQDGGNGGIVWTD